MESFLLYILESGVCLLVFYVCFKALFSNDTFFRFNRWLLLAGTGICMLLPFCRIKTSRLLPFSRPVSQLEIVFQEEEAMVFLVPEKEETTTGATEQEMTSVPWTGIIGMLYLTGCCICLATTALSFRKMYQLAGSGRKLRSGMYTLILLPDSLSPFSWGRSIFLSEDDYRNHPDEILTHEKIHLRYNHSADLLYMEMILLLQWFNPAAWLLKRELRDIHEYQADKGVLSQGIDATKYQLLLVKKAVGSSLYTLANSFNHSKIKKRITMMLKKESNNWARLKLVLLVPVGLVALSAFARPEVGTDSSFLPVVEQPKQKSPLLSPSKSTQSQPDDKTNYNVYLSFTKKNDEGKEVIDGISIYGVGEDKALQVAGKAIANGRFAQATLVIICPYTPKVPKSYLEKMKGLFDKNGIKCKITQAQGYDKEGNALPTPPPPPPAPDGMVVFSYRDGSPDQHFVLYERHLHGGGLEQRIDKIYRDDIKSITIKIYDKAPDGFLEDVKQTLEKKIKYQVEYNVSMCKTR